MQSDHGPRRDGTCLEEADLASSPTKSSPGAVDANTEDLSARQEIVSEEIGAVKSEAEEFAGEAQTVDKKGDLSKKNPKMVVKGGNLSKKKYQNSSGKSAVEPQKQDFKGLSRKSSEGPPPSSTVDFSPSVQTSKGLRRSTVKVLGPGAVPVSLDQAKPLRKGLGRPRNVVQNSVSLGRAAKPGVAVAPPQSFVQVQASSATKGLPTWTHQDVYVDKQVVPTIDLERNSPPLGSHDSPPIIHGDGNQTGEGEIDVDLYVSSFGRGENGLNEETMLVPGAVESNEVPGYVPQEPSHIVNPESDRHLAVATLVPAASRADLENAQPVDSDDVRKHEILRKQKDARDRRVLWFAIGFALVIAVSAILVVIVTAVLKGTPDSVATPPPSQTASVAPAESPFRELFPLPNYTRLAIQYYNNSAQARAYSWLLNDPNLHSYGEWKRRQRFALAVLYYSTDGPNWKFQEFWLNYTVDECRWFWMKHKSRTTPCFYNLTSNSKYEALYLGGNDLKGTIPPELGMLDKVRDLNLDKNYLIGTLPSQLFEATKLGMIWVDANLELEGTLPTEIGLLSQGYFMFFGDTRISGTLPSELGLMKDLLKFNIHGSRISGTIPSEIGLCKELKHLYVSMVPTLTGKIPSQIGQLSELRNLYTYKSQLEGPLPSEIGLLSSLELVKLHGNMLSGSVPSEIGLLLSSSTLEIRLEGNNFSGRIPSELGMLTQLTYLSMESNQLTGNIPEELKNLKLIETLNVTGNGLTGVVPHGVCSAFNSSVFQFDCSASLCGCDCLCSLLP